MTLGTGAAGRRGGALKHKGLAKSIDFAMRVQCYRTEALILKFLLEDPPRGLWLLRPRLQENIPLRHPTHTVIDMFGGMCVIRSLSTDRLTDRYTDRCKNCTDRTDREIRDII